MMANANIWIISKKTGPFQPIMACQHEYLLCLGDLLLAVLEFPQVCQIG
jgi:hypothetical protein